MSSSQRFLPLFLLAAAIASAEKPKEGDVDEYDKNQYAPPEAYLPGDPLPYFGSENPWNRRWFYTEKLDEGRAGQREQLDLLEGRTEEAVAFCRERLKANGLELESLFNLALGLARLGRIDEAGSALNTALDLGLPPSRIVAGPRAYTAALRDTAAFRRARAECHGLVHGPLLGSVTPVAARVWVRTENESKVEVRLSRSGNFAEPDARATGTTRSAEDYTAVLAVDGLTPQTTYQYQLWIGGQPVPRGTDWHFTTFPSDEDRGVVRVAFGGCAQYEPRNERMWDVIRLREPQAFMILGDNVYIDLPQVQNPFLDYTYYRRQSRPEFRRLVAGVPVYAIWDDHDAGIDDVFLGPYPDKPAWKVDFFRLFRRNWNNPSYGAEPERPGVWFKFRIGEVEFFMLDGRYYRENYLKPNPSMLGPVQKKWLLDSLAKSTATFKVLVSPVAWADDAKAKSVTGVGEKIEASDIWGGFKAEREEIFDFLADRRMEGVLLVSGDRHRADLRKNERTRGYPLYELMCSWLTNPQGTGSAGHPLWEYTTGPSFALLTFDTTKTDPTLAMEVSTITGEPVLKLTLKLSEMRDR